MVILGLILIALGVVAIVAAVFASGGDPTLLGFDLSTLALFLIGVAAGAGIIWGWSILKYGTKQGLRARRERRKLAELSEKLDRVQTERDADRDVDLDRGQ